MLEVIDCFFFNNHYMLHVTFIFGFLHDVNSRYFDEKSNRNHDSRPSFEMYNKNLMLPLTRARILDVGKHTESRKNFALPKTERNLPKNSLFVSMRQLN